MCGIIAISSSKGIRFQIEKSIEAISHRGPDDNGIFISSDRDGQLGHVRLSIIDLTSAGHQPMNDATGRYIITFNGEIYNFEILKRYLERDYGKINWRSSSDTELILEGFAREGISFFSKLNGIFAFAIYDNKKKELHVLRDPIGIKPLYFSTQQGNVFFCSELKGLLVFPQLKATIRKQSLADQLAYMYVPEPYTMYEEFFKVEPGILFSFRNGKKISETELFSELHKKIYFSSENDMIDRFRETFGSAVKRQLMSDVPISLLLSGGLDSSAIAYEAVKKGANIKTAYTISFSKEDTKYDQQSDDLFYAKKIAKQLNLKLEIINAKPEFISLLPSLIPFLEDGISDPAAINTFLICETARKEGVKVMLSGHGADEYLAGYRRYYAEHLISGLSSSSRKLLSFAHGILPSAIPGRLNSVYRRLKRFTFAAKQEQKDRLASYYMWGNPTSIQNLFIDKASILPGYNLNSFFEEHKTKDVLKSMLLADQSFDLRSLNLAYTDKMSMAVGVEARVPFLDFEMVRLMNSIPANMLMRGNIQKYILKRSMEQRLPKEVIYREKAGFALPIRSWFREKNEVIDEYFNRERIKKQGIFDPKTIENLLKAQFSGKRDNSYLLFSMLCQQIWLDKQS